MSRTRKLLRPILFMAFLSCKVFSQDTLPELYYTGQYQQVVALAQQAIQEGDPALPCFYFKALSEIQLGLTGEAVETLETGFNVYKDDPGLRRMLAGIYFNAGDYIKAGEQYRSLVKQEPLDVSSWLKMAEIASFRQHYDEALEALGQVLSIDSVNLEGLMMTGDILYGRKISRSIDYYERALRNYPENQKAAYALANAYIQEKRPGDAINICRLILASDSANIRFTKLLGYACYKAGHPRDAARYLEKAAWLGDSTVFCFKFLGISRYLNIDMNGAIEALTIAARKDSMDAELHFFLGASLASTGEKDSAMWYLNRALELMQPDPVIISRIYSEQANLKRLEASYQEAYDLYRKAWEADRDQLMPLYYMASIQDNSLNNYEKALDDYTFFIEQLDKQPLHAVEENQIPTVRKIVEDRIITLKENLFFQDR